MEIHRLFTMDDRPPEPHQNAAVTTIAVVIILLAFAIATLLT